jgi:hypothetical protein
MSDRIDVHLDGGELGEKLYAVKRKKPLRKVFDKFNDAVKVRRCGCA